MHHEFLDKYSDKDSPVHRIDARAKLISTLAGIGLCVSTPADEYVKIGGFLVLFYLIAISAGIPILYVVRNSAMVLPFTLALTVFIPFSGEKAGAFYSFGGFNVGTSQVILMTSVMGKALTGATGAVVLASTTRFSDMLDGLRRMKVPVLITDVLSFFYRYIFVLIDEVERMRMGMKARNYRAVGVRDVKVIGSAIGVLFLRSFERGERVYLAMKSRLYEGGALTGVEGISISAGDIFYIVSIVSICIGLRFWKI